MTFLRTIGVAAAVTAGLASASTAQAKDILIGLMLSLIHI